MSTQPSSTPDKQSAAPKRVSRSHLLPYLIMLFLVAFLLLLMSYFMQQRRADQQVIEGLQQNSSALQITRSLQETNQALRDQLAAAQAETEALTAKAENSEKTTLALDWLWRIQREFFRGRYSSARSLIREFESDGLKAYLPTVPLVDPDYRSPAEQYEALYNSLF